MSNPEQAEPPVKNLCEFIERVQKMRADWQILPHKELWFRGESKKYDTLLRPGLYRPSRERSLKPIPELLEIEHDLYQRFMQNGGPLTNEKPDKKDERWDWYFLMQHHGAPNRLLDWTDGALMALHFAIRDTDKDSQATNDKANPRVFVLEPDRMQGQWDTLPDSDITKQRWKEYLEKHPDEKLCGLTEEDWEESYLPGDTENLKELPLPRIPLFLYFERISRRVAAQRSQFMVFGTDPFWLEEEFNKSESLIKEIVIDASAAYELRIELRGCGITESVIYPDLDGLGRELGQMWKDRR